MESQQQRKQSNWGERQQQHDGFEVIDLTSADTLNDHTDYNADAAASKSRGSEQSSVPHEPSAQQRSHNSFNTTSEKFSNAFALGGVKNLIDLDPQLRESRLHEQEQEQPGLEVEPSHDGSAGLSCWYDLPNLGTANGTIVLASGSNDDDSRLQLQQRPGLNASDLGAEPQAIIVHNQHLDTPFLRLPPDLAAHAHELIHSKGWSRPKVWHWYYNGMPVEEAPRVANDPRVIPAPLELLESEGIYEFHNWSHCHHRRTNEGIDPRQCKTVRLTGLDVEVVLFEGDDAGEEGSKILLNHILAAKEAFPNLKKLSFAQRALGAPTEASYGIKELFRRRFVHACQLTCTSAFEWSLTFSATHRGLQEDQEPRTEKFEVFITHFRAQKAFEEELAKLRLKRREIGIEAVKQRLCRDIVDDMDGIRHKFATQENFTRLMELRHVLACLSIQSTLEQQVEAQKRDQRDTGWVQTEPCKGWASTKGCYPRFIHACQTARCRMELRQLLLKMPPGFHLLYINNSSDPDARRIFTEAMTFAETWFPRLFFTDDLRKKYGNPWTVTETTENDEPTMVTEDTRPVVPEDRASAIDASRTSSNDRSAMTASRNDDGQKKDKGKKRRTSTEGQREERRRADQALLTRLSRPRRQAKDKAILPKEAESQQPLVSNSKLDSFQEAAHNSHLAETRPTVPSESIREAVHNSHLIGAPSDNPQTLHSHPQFNTAVGWPQYNSEAFMSMVQPGNQHSPDNSISNTELVAGTQSIVPNYDPQPYPSHQSSEYVMGWQQPSSQAYNAADQLENQFGFNDYYSLPNDSFQPYPSYPQAESAVGWQ